ETAYGSKTKVWWLCPNGHAYDTKVLTRTRQGSGCRFCRNLDVLPERSLAAEFPAIAAEWHPTKNGDLTPSAVAPKTSRKVWWRCPHGHDYQAVVANRTFHGSGCPECSIAPESRQEVMLKFEIALFFDIDMNRRKVPLARRGVVDVDAVISSEHMIVEFDGSYWHRASAIHDSWKSTALRSSGWRVVRVREAPLHALHDDDVVVPTGASSKATANIVLTHLFARLNRDQAELAEYLAASTPQNVSAAERYIEALLAASQREVPKRRRRFLKSWQEGFDHLVRYVDECGDASPSRDYIDPDDQFRLGVWVHDQRRRRSDLSPERQQLLESVGFVWRVLDAQWEAGYTHLQSFVETNG
ncbi:DUF559 domain-containing protein, partial [bacterium]|nr:DUF559 domain-containing protein [bacterium]